VVGEWYPLHTPGCVLAAILPRVYRQGPLSRVHLAPDLKVDVTAALIAASGRDGEEALGSIP